jgi:hypothetical protein
MELLEATRYAAAEAVTKSRYGARPVWNFKTKTWNRGRRWIGQMILLVPNVGNEGMMGLLWFNRFTMV